MSFGAYAAASGSFKENSSDVVDAGLRETCEQGGDMTSEGKRTVERSGDDEGRGRVEDGAASLISFGQSQKSGNGIPVFGVHGGDKSSTLLKGARKRRRGQRNR
jgi:hypothetical protein